MIADFLKQARIVLEETVASFRRNNDLAAASSLAFSSSLALIPALFLVTTVLGLAVGSSHEAARKVQDLLRQFFPAYTQDILREVRRIAAYKGTIGLVNIFALLLAVVPLVSSLRSVLSSIFRKPPRRTFLLEKLFDAALTVVFIVGIASIGVMGVAITVVERFLAVRLDLGYLSGTVPFVFMVVAVFLLYLSFAGKAAPRHLLAGALAGAALWFLMRPLFHLFLAYNPGYGLAFGSFKSIFVLTIWLYYSMIVFLLGAEVAANLGRKDLAVVKRLVSARSGIPQAALEKFVLRFGRGEAIFSGGEAGDRMFFVLKGSVAIRKGEREIAVVGQGQYFGMVSFLLGTPRIASATALEDAELAAITGEDLGHLMHESPEIILAMLKETARRLRETNRQIE